MRDGERIFSADMDLKAFFGSDDAREGAIAFAQKRPPVWQGKWQLGISALRPLVSFGFG